MNKLKKKVRQYHNTNIQKLAEYLDTIPWNFFITGSTAYELTLKSTRRLAGRFFNRLPPGTWFFWVAEKFEVRDGHHLHGLLMLPEKKYPDNLPKPVIKDNLLVKVLAYTWQESAGERFKLTENEEKFKLWHQIDLKPYMKGVGAHGYCGKYINKKRADYDLLI